MEDRAGDELPNNPTGYSITAEEADKIVAALCEAADDGRNLIVVTDDAYFGLFYEDDVLRESLFSRLAGCHERIMAVKVDGPTKEEYVWGLRTGMLTFGAKAFLSDEALYGALEKRWPAPSAAPSQLFARCPIGALQGHGG